MQNLPKDNAIEALVPLYTPRGDSTRICLTGGGEIIFQKSISSIISKLAKRHSINLILLRASAQDLLGQKESPPLLFSDELLLVPLKMRKPRAKGDSSFGYLNYRALAATTAAQKETLIETASRHLLHILWSIETTESHLRSARLLDSIASQNKPLIHLLKLLTPLATDREKAPNTMY
jgi:hypothetical protein